MAQGHPFLQPQGIDLKGLQKYNVDHPSLRHTTFTFFFWRRQLASFEKNFQKNLNLTTSGSIITGSQYFQLLQIKGTNQGTSNIETI